MPFPSLSVVIPNFNHSDHLAACLASVMNQSVPATEVVVIDDGSTDNSLQVLEELARKYSILKIYSNEKNLGIFPTVNRGIELARGDYYLSLAADDKVKPGFFEKALGLLGQHPQAGFCGAICQFEDLGRGLKYYYGLNVAEKPRYFSPEEMVQKSRCGRLQIFATPMILRRQCLIDAGKFEAEMKWCSDWFTCWVIGYRHGICFIPEILGEFKKYPTSYSGKGMRDSRERIEIYRSILDHLALPQYAESAERIRRGAALASFGKEMLWLIARHQTYRRFLTPAYLRRALWWSLKAETKEVLPDFLARWCMNVAGYTFKTGNAAKNSTERMGNAPV